MIYVFLIFLFILFIFYILNYYFDLQNEYNIEKFIINNIDKNEDIDIVIARYNEDLKWTLESPFDEFKYIVYNKGDNEDFEKENVKEIIKLPNVGKCDHTYLYHVIHNYNNLADITVFFPGSIDLKYKKRIAKKLLHEVTLRENAVFMSLNEYDIKKLHYGFKMDNYKTNHKANLLKNPEVELKKSEIRPFGKWFDNMFGDIKVNCIMYYGIFSIHKNDIIQHPVDKYETIIKELSDHSNPEVGHYTERSWCAIFHPLKKTNIVRYNKL